MPFSIYHMLGTIGFTVSISHSATRFSIISVSPLLLFSFPTSIFQCSLCSSISLPFYKKTSCQNGKILDFFSLLLKNLSMGPYGQKKRSRLLSFFLLSFQTNSPSHLGSSSHEPKFLVSASFPHCFLSLLLPSLLTPSSNQNPTALV